MALQPCLVDSECASGVCIGGVCQAPLGLKNIAIQIGSGACPVQYWYSSSTDGLPDNTYPQGTVPPGQSIIFQGPSPANRHLGLIIQDVQTRGQNLFWQIWDSQDIKQQITSCSGKMNIYNNKAQTPSWSLPTSTWTWLIIILAVV